MKSAIKKCSNCGYKITYTEENIEPLPGWGKTILCKKCNCRMKI